MVNSLELFHHKTIHLIPKRLECSKTRPTKAIILILINDREVADGATAITVTSLSCNIVVVTNTDSILIVYASREEKRVGLGSMVSVSVFVDVDLGAVGGSDVVSSSYSYRGEMDTLLVVMLCPSPPSQPPSIFSVSMVILINFIVSLFLR